MCIEWKLRYTLIIIAIATAVSAAATPMPKRANIYPSEGKESKKPSLREAQRIVALISGENAKKVRESLSSVEEENEAVEKFCILMDWEVEPEDVLHCVKNSDGTFTMQVNDGTQFKYNPIEDCLE